MKKIIICATSILSFISISLLANPTDPGCPKGTTGICVPIYGESGTITSYLCSDAEGSIATKDCKLPVP